MSCENDERIKKKGKNSVIRTLTPISGRPWLPNIDSGIGIALLVKSGIPLTSHLPAVIFAIDN
ncbi:MAG: hypothetical protein M3270_10120 [Thermoproteota archaeon]|nr:hypothetical protein [Thermoproteota archaeon]